MPQSRYPFIINEARVHKITTVNIPPLEFTPYKLALIRISDPNRPKRTGIFQENVIRPSQDGEKDMERKHGNRRTTQGEGVWRTAESY